MSRIPPLNVVFSILAPPPVQASPITGNGYVWPLAYGLQWLARVVWRSSVYLFTRSTPWEDES